MLTHDQIIYALGREHGLVHGQDFIAGQRIDQQTGQQLDDAFIVRWNAAIPEPTKQELAALCARYTLGYAREAKLAEINARFSAEAAAVLAPYPEEERATWPFQQREALDWGSNPATPTPYLDGLAAVRGLDPAVMRQKTLDQVHQFVAISQQLVGKRQRLRDAVYAVQDGPGAAAELAAIEW